MTTMSKDERADLRARTDAALKAKAEAEQLQAWDEANKHWRELVKLVEVDMGQRPYYPADQATYGQL